MKEKEFIKIQEDLTIQRINTYFKLIFIMLLISGIGCLFLIGH